VADPLAVELLKPWAMRRAGVHRDAAVVLSRPSQGAPGMRHGNQTAGRISQLHALQRPGRPHQCIPRASRGRGKGRDRRAVQDLPGRGRYRHRRALARQAGSDAR